MLQARDPDTKQTKRLRTACDICHQAKMKCSGGTPCNGCRDSGYDCFYSVSNRIGRPKGTKNKRTLERLSRNQKDLQIDSKSSHNRRTSTLSEDVSPRSSPTSFDFSMNGDPSVVANGITNTSIDAVLDSIGSAYLPDPGTFEMFPNDFSSLSDFGDLTQFPLLEQQQAFETYQDPFAFSHGSPQGYAHGDLSCVSPSNLFNDLSLYARDDSHATMSTSSSSSSAASWSRCNCFQNHAELVCRLKELEQKRAAPRLDNTLLGVQQALIPWKEVIDCHLCQQDDNQEILVLSTNIIRTVLHAMSTLCADIYRTLSSSCRERRKQLSQVKPPPSMESAFGVFDVAGDDQIAAMDTLIYSILGKVKLTLSRFKERLEATSARKMSNASSFLSNASLPWQASVDRNVFPQGLPSDLAYLTHLREDLESTIQMLENVLKKVWVL